MKENFGALLMIEIKEKDLKEKENHYIKLVEAVSYTHLTLPTKRIV